MDWKQVYKLYCEIMPLAYIPVGEDAEEKISKMPQKTLDNLLKVLYIIKTDAILEALNKQTDFTYN